MNKILLTLVVAFAAVQSFAHLQLGVRDAIVSSAYNGDAGNALEEASSGDALTFEVNYKLTQSVGVHTSLGLELGAFTEERGVDRAHYDYNRAYLDLILPVMFRYNFTPGWFAEVGPAMSFNLVTYDWIDDEDAKKVKDTEVFDLGVAVGAGYVFGFGLGIDSRLNFGVLDKFKHVDGTMARFYIGLSYWFKR